MKNIIKNQKSKIKNCLMIIKNQKSKIKNCKNCLIFAAFVILSGCQQPEDLTPPVARLGFNSITANFVNETTGEFYGEFTAQTLENSNELVIVIPFYYPESSTNEVTQAMLSKMRVRANLDDNVTISPSLLYMDFTKDNVITVTNESKKKIQYTIRADVRKSNAAYIEDFSIPVYGLSGIINETTRAISLPAFPSEEPVLAEYRLSHHATISPDPSQVAFEYIDEVEFTVTAHDGVTKNVYSVKQYIAPKTELGMRLGSARIMFEKRLNADLGITTPHLTGGIAVTENHVILNTRGEKSIFIDAKTGNIAGEFDLGDVKGNLTNFYTTSDRAGNVVICNLAQSDGNFKVWRLKDMDGTTELFIDWSENTTDIIGRKISIQGNLDEDAIITAPLFPTTTRFARWVVVDGELTSPTPEIITIGGFSNWANHCDIVYTSASNVNSDYFVAGYANTGSQTTESLGWVNGATNQIRHKLTPIEVNFVPNSVDYIEFNNAKYVAFNFINGFPWGGADDVWLLDVTTDAQFSGSTQSRNCAAVVWEAERNKYGPRAIQAAPDNENQTGDLAMTVSPDGYYLFLYFMFTNGYVVGVQFDCIDM